MNYVVYFDVETGGVEPQHPTIQLAAIAVDSFGVEASSFEQKIAFRVEDCNPEALAVNHYTAEAWKDANSEGVCIAKFTHWLRPFMSVQLTSKRTNMPYSVAQLSGYNALVFDAPRLRAMYGGSFFPCSYLVRDVLQRALFWFDEHPAETPPENFKLSTVAQRFGIDTTGAHDALTDVRICAKLAKALRG